ncbi:MAG: sarcosine oxidase [Alphaproteobacteria bacterium]|nr:sarcosine oxidase [Alphaproteobacteria bacterium]
MAAVDPTAFARRSFVHRQTKRAGGRFAELDGAAVALAYANDDARAAGQLGLADLCALPRWGFKGRAALDWLRTQSVRGLDADNRATAQYDGARALRLSPGEALLLPGFDGTSQFLGRIVDSWSLDGAPGTYAVPRADSHYWFVVSGAHAAAMFAKLCGVDLRPHVFPNGAIAQTSVARSSAIVARRDLGRTLAYDLLGDSAQAGYMWACVEDAMAEFAGRPVGLEALRTLAAEPA